MKAAHAAKVEKVQGALARASRLRPVFVILLAVSLILSACNLPVAPSVTPTSSSNVLTAAAVTVEALKTIQAGQTPQPPAATATLGNNTQPTATSAGPAPTATNTRIPPTATPQPCDAAGFISDVTVADGTKMSPGQTFTKTWRLRNNGTCTWNKNYALVFASGESMGAPAVVNLIGDVSPGATVDVSVEMKAPATAGKYTGNWRLRNPSGVIFGVEGDTSFYVMIEVVANTPTLTATAVTLTPTATSTTPAGGLIYDFSASACKAEWRTVAGGLTCPGTVGDAKGVVSVLVNPSIETGDVETKPVLLTQPEGVENGVITGVYPVIKIEAGYRFHATLACLGSLPECSVKYQLNYREGNAQPVNLGQWSQTSDGLIQGVNVDLSGLAGKSVQIILVVLADGSANQDGAVWISPRISKD